MTETKISQVLRSLLAMGIGIVAVVGCFLWAIAGGVAKWVSGHQRQ